MADLDTPISQIPPIQESRASRFGPSAFYEFIELPALEVCKRLYQYGVRTLDSSANYQNIGRHAGVTMEMESLCTVNDRKIRTLAKRHPDQVVIEQNDEWGEIARFQIPIPHGHITAR